MSPIEIAIDTFGIRPRARLLGIVPSTVLRWREKGFVPIEYVGTVVQASDGAISEIDMVYGRTEEAFE